MLKTTFNYVRFAYSEALAVATAKGAGVSTAQIDLWLSTKP